MDAKKAAKRLRFVRTTIDLYKRVIASQADALMALRKGLRVRKETAMRIMSLAGVP